MFNFLPSWTAVYTAAESEAQLHNFKFKGPGWYIHKDATIIVVPLSSAALTKGGGCWAFDDGENPIRSMWRQRDWPPEQKFTFYVYDVECPAASFNALANAPVKVDEQE